MSRILRALLIPALAAAAGLGGCSGELPFGPLGSPGDGGTVCVPAKQRQMITFGADRLANTSGEDLRITAVRLQSPENITLGEAHVIPLTSGPLLGVQSHYPPSLESLTATGISWAARVPAKGAVLVGHGSYNLVVGLAATARISRLAYVDVEYESVASSEKYHYHSNVGVEILTNQEQCP